MLYSVDNCQKIKIKNKMEKHFQFFGMFLKWLKKTIFSRQQFSTQDKRFYL